MKTLLCLLALVSVNFVNAGGWMTDYNAALEQAKLEKKMVLIDFTGSDWCIWCMKLEKEVFSQNAFQNWAPSHVVLLKLDFPRGKPQPDNVKKANAELMEKYGVQGFPTIILVDETGKEKARTGYRRGGAEEYVKHLNSLLK